MAFCYCFVISQGVLLVGLRVTVEHVLDSTGAGRPRADPLHASSRQHNKLGEPVCVCLGGREGERESCISTMLVGWLPQSTCLKMKSVHHCQKF